MGGIDELKRRIMGSGHWQTETTDRGYKTYYKEDEPNILKRTFDYLGSLIPKTPPVEASTPAPATIDQLKNNVIQKTPELQGGFKIPGIPDDIAQTLGSVLVGQGEPLNATAAASILSHPYQKQVKGEGLGENPTFATVLDTKNRINQAGNYDSNAPIKQVLNPFTGQTEDSIDRGLWRINNGTFYDYQRRMPKLLEQYGITSYEDMNDPTKNTVMGKIIMQNQGPRGWFAAPDTLTSVY